MTKCSRYQCCLARWSILVVFALFVVRGWQVDATVQGAAPPQAKAEKKPNSAKESTAKQREEDYELQQILVDTLDQVQRNYVREVSRRKLVEAAIKGILSELDPYSNYITPEEMDRFRTVVESEFGGIGLMVAQDGDHLRVSSPLVGTPAYRAGIVAGDRIAEIDGQTAVGLKPEEAARRLKGKPGTAVALTIVHGESGETKKIALVREVIHVDTVLGDHRRSDDRWDFMLDREKKIGYVRISNFSRETAADLRRALQELKQQNIRGLVLDLRFNPGGLLSSAIDVCRLFISQGRIVSTAGRNSPERVWDAEKGPVFEGFPMAILVNRYSASASEIVSACLQDHKRAVVIGERTWGKGSVQNVIPLDNRFPGGDSASTPGPQSALKLTTAGYHRPSGKNIDRAPGAKESDPWGVSPDAGFDVKLEDADTRSLLRVFEQRNVILPKKAAGAAAVPPPASAQPDKAPAAAKKNDAPAAAGKNDKSPAGDKPASNGKPAPAQADAAKSAAPFADRQLQKAIEYLNTELARAK